MAYADTSEFADNTSTPVDSASSSSTPAEDTESGVSSTNLTSLGTNSTGTELPINEVSYDKCTENMVRILVSSDAEQVPTVTLQTTKSGKVFAILAEEQPYAEIKPIL